MATFERVLTMAGWMESKLEKNRHKGDEAGWRMDEPLDLLRRLEEEVAELKKAIEGGEHSSDVWAEAADVANFAMMVADTYEQDEANSWSHPA